FRWRVGSTDAQQLRGAFQFFRAELHTHLREVLVTRNLVRLIDLDPPVYFARTTIVEDHIRAGRGIVTAATASELRILFTGKKRGCHRHGFECRAGNVVSAERTTHEWLVALVCFETDPRRFIVDFLETVGRLTVEREYVASLRIEYDNSAVLALQLIDGSLLQPAIDREAHVLIASEFDLFASNDFERFRKYATLDTEKRTLQSRIAAIRSEDMGQRLVHRVLALDGAAGIASVVGEWLVHATAPIEDPTAQG